MSTSGTKHDTGKPDLSLLPTHALEETARALMFGANKYGRYNYCQGFEDTRLAAACLRHVYSFLNGEEKDPESGLSHLAHAMATLSMMMHCQDLGTLRDNRYRKEKP